MRQVVDTAQRARALDAEQSFICEAPAGSGKTELLTQRLLTLLARVKQPEEILAITFTRKAAGEMRSRVIRALGNAAKHPQPDSEHEKLTWRLASEALAADTRLGWNLLHYPSRLQIKTFDGLCASLANTLPWHSSFATPPAVSEDSKEVYLAAVRELLASLEGEGFWVDSLATVLSLLDNNSARLENLLVSMLSKRDAWLPVVGHTADKDVVREILEANLRQAREESSQRLRAEIPWTILEKLLKLAAFAASTLASENPQAALLCFFDFDLNVEDEGEEIELSPQQWQILCSLLVTKSGTWRKRVDKRDGFPAGVGKEEKAAYKDKKQQLLEIVGALSESAYLLDLIADMNNLPSASYSEKQRRLLAAVTDILPASAMFLIAEFQKQNCVDFTEVSLRASQALGDLDSPSDLALALDYKIQHILVDEFQDTSPPQIELLKRLTAGWQLGDGRSMFCVGDAMQSIYGFRNANVGLFLKCLESGLGDVALEPLRLSTNFRSQENLVQWINSSFSRAFPAHNDISIGAVSYANSVAFAGPEVGAAVSVYGFHAQHYNQDEANKIVEIIRRRRQQKPDASVAILVRNRGHIKHITPALQDAGLFYRAVDLEQLSEHIEIQDLMALTHALLRPTDKIAWLSVLRAPWCGLSLQDLEGVTRIAAPENKRMTVLKQISLLHHWISQEPEHVDIAMLSADGRQRLQRVVPLLQQAHKNSQRKSLRHWIEGLWIQLGGPACLENQGALKNCDIFFNLLETLDTNTVLKARDALEKAVAKLFAAADPKSDESLQIMTIHKSKGLEFDTVILPSLHRIGRAADSELLRWYERISDSGEPQLIMSPITSSGSEQDQVYAHVAYQEKRREANESCRLLYVACTRAKQYLHLFNQIQPKEEGASTLEELKAPPKNALVASIWDSVKNTLEIKEHDHPMEDPKSSEGASQIPAIRPIRRLVKGWMLPELPQGDLLSSFIPFFEHSNAAPPNTLWQDSTLRLVGTVVHRLLQDLTLERLNMWRDIFSCAQQAGVEGVDQNHLGFWRSLLVNAGVESSKLNAALERLGNIVRAMSENMQLREVFSSPKNTRRAELGVTALVATDDEHSVERADLSAKQMAIDLLWMRSETEIWIIDYKTGDAFEGEKQADFFRRELALYKPIMGQYRDTVATILENSMAQRDIRLFLYFPLLDEWVEYEQGEQS